MQRDAAGRYKLGQRLAVGGTAEVFRAEVRWPDGHAEQVVVKKILPQYATDARFRRFFRDEARLVSELRHPNIVRVLDLGSMQGTLFLALEYVPGADLDRLLKQLEQADHKLPPPVAAHAVAAVCDALAYIHTRKSSDGAALHIVHRDISPHNILVSATGEVKLSDFGIAQSILQSERTTQGTIKGKFDYMSPEQATPGTPLDARSDLFALGSVLYRALFDLPPFRGSTDVGTLTRVRECRYHIQAGKLPAEHRQLEAIIARCLQRDPDNRYPTARAVAKDLRTYLRRYRDLQQNLAQWCDFALALEQASERELGEDLLFGGSGMTRPTELLQSERTDVDPLAPSLSSTEQTSVLASAPRPPTGPQPSRRRALRWALPLGLAAVTAVGLAAGIALFPGAPGSDALDASSAQRSAAARPPDASLSTGDGTTTVDAAGPDGTSAPPAKAAPDAARSAAAGPLAAERALLHLTSRPAGARVRIDGQPRGVTPLTLPAPRTPYRVTLRLRGHRDWTRSLPAPKRTLRLRARLIPLPRPTGRLTVNAIPWARVYVDGRLLGGTPLVGARLPAGNHRVLLRDRSGKLLRSVTVRIRRGKTSVLSHDRSRKR